MTRRKSRRRALVVATIIINVVGTIVARRRGYSAIGGRTPVRCRDGHIFRTIWVPGVSLKAVRLGWYRFQFCPVGRHWTTVKPIKDGDYETELNAEGSIPDDIAIP